MKRISLISAFIAAAMLLTACSDKKSSGSDTPATSEASTSSTSADTSASSEASSATTDVPTGSHITNGDDGELTDSQIIELLTNTVQAGIDRNYMDFCKYSDMSLSYYLSKGEWLDDDELSEFLGTDPGSAAYFILYDTFKDANVTFVNPEPVSEDELAAINSYIPKIGEANTGEWETPLSEVRFDSAYKAYIRYNDQPVDDLTARMYVVKLNGEWKAEAYVTFVMEMYGEFNDAENNN